MLKKITSPHHAWKVLLSLSVIEFFALPILFSAAGIYIPFIEQDLSISSTALVLYLTVETLVMALFSPLLSRHLNRIPVRKGMTLALSVFYLTSMLLSRANQPWHWYLAGLFMGISGLYLQVLIPVTLISKWFHQKSGLAAGIMWGCGGIGGIILSPIMTLLLEHVGWRTTYLVMGSIALIISLIVSWLYLSYQPSHLGMNAYGQVDSSKTVSDLPFNGLFDVQLPRHVWLLFSFAIIIMISFIASITTVLPTYLSHMSMLKIMAIVFTVFQVGNALGNFFLPLLTDWLTITKANAIGALCGIIGALIYLFTPSHHLIIYSLGSLLLGMASAMPALIPINVRKFYGLADYPRLYGLHFLVQNTSVSLIMPLMTILMSKVFPKAIFIVSILTMTSLMALFFIARHFYRKPRVLHPNK